MMRSPSTSRRLAHRCVLAAVVIAALCAVPRGRLWGSLIVLRPNAETQTSVVLLGDVAEISEADPDRRTRLQQVTLAPAPAPGQSLKLDFATIRSRLQAQGVDLVSLEFGGSAVVTVTSGAAASGAANSARSGAAPNWQRDRAADLVAAAVSRRLAQLAPELGPVNVEVMLNNDDIEPLLLARANSLDVVGGRPPWNVPQSFLVQFADRDGVAREVRVTCRLSARPLIPTARYHLARGHILRADDIIFQPATTVEEKYPTRDELIGMEVVRGLRQGEAISARSVQSVPLVRSGSLVTVYSRIGNISVKRVMKARGDGSRGETVPLEALDTRDQVEALVCGVNEAEIVAPGATSLSSPTSRGAVHVEFTDAAPSTSPTAAAPRSATIAPVGGFSARPLQSGPGGPPRSVPVPGPYSVSTPR